MTALVVNRSDVFPVGTTVKAFPVAGRAVSEGRPSGQVTVEATVDANGKWEAEPETGRYVLAAEVAGVWRQLVADSRAFGGRGTLQERIAQRRVANGVSY